MKGRGKNLLLALLFSTIVIVVVAIGFNVLSAGTFGSRIFQILGGDLPSGIIQFLTYIAFFWGYFEINERVHKIKHEEKSFDLKLLPEQEHWVFSPDDLTELKVKMIEHQKNDGDYLLVDIIKKATTKFRANKSISDVLDIVTSQVRINISRAESGQSVTRYLAWAIPSVGFIGTILGIAQSLSFADQADTEEGLALVTSAMYVAFDTTLVSLVLSIFLMWFFHSLQEREEDLHTNMEEYIIENLVNRIHIE